MVDLLKTFLSGDVENKIDEYLKLKSTKFLSELNLDLNSKYISLKFYSLDDLEQLRSIWLEVANISVKLYTEYEFFRQFSFPNRYKFQPYVETLKKLGYIQDKGIWKINQIPNKQCIIENIFFSYIYNFLCQEKKQELDNEKFTKENAENSKKLENRNNVINEQLIRENIDNDAIPSNREMGNIDIGLCEMCSSEVLDGICTICQHSSNVIINNRLVNIDPDPVDVIDADRIKEPMSNASVSFNGSNKAICSNENTSLQKKEVINEDYTNKMRSNSPKTSRNSRIISNLPSQWTCNVCSFNQNKSNNITCEVCMSSKFAKINSCVFESSYEASNENKIDNEEYVENIFIAAENEDKWACTKCTFNNKITDNLCVVCLEPNIRAIGDYELPEETWCCKQCGENNLFECYKCKNCRIPAEFFNKWRCDQCSYYNDKVAKRCKVCEIGNPYSVKCSLCSKNLVNNKYDKICKQCTISDERCTNKQTVDYQDSRETQSGMSVISRFFDKRRQIREEINEKQNNLKNNDLQTSEIGGKDPNVDRKINNKRTGDENVNKTQPKLFLNFDANSEKRNENKVQNKNDGSQNVEGKRKFSNVGIRSNYQKTDDLTIYNVVYSAPSETPGSNKSLPENDRNSGKPNKNEIISNKDIQQKPEPKNKIPNVEAQNKMKSKPCKNCKSNVCANNQYWCTECENLQWFCKNEACGGINYQNEYCKQCKAKIGSNFLECTNFWLMKESNEEVQMWQCGFCLQFNAGTLKKCNKCKNHRDLSCYKKCECN